MNASKIVYGANCTWWDSIDKIGLAKSSGNHNLPCCPHCKSVLFEVDNMDAWMKGVEAHEQNGHPGYRNLLLWMRGKCFNSMNEAEKAYELETRKHD